MARAEMADQRQFRAVGPTPRHELASSAEERISNTVFSSNEESLIKVVRMLPPGEAKKVIDWAQQLADLGGCRPLEWSDSWSEDDLREATAASLKRFEQQEREGV